MGIVETYLNTAVHTDKSRMFMITNPMDEDFNFFWNTSEIDANGAPIPAQKFTIPKGISLTYPSDIGMYACIELAKKIVYKKNPALGLVKERWLSTAEGVISEIGAEPEGEAKKTQAEIIREKVEAINTEPKVVEAPKEEEVKEVSIENVPTKPTLIKQLEEKGFKMSNKNDAVAKTYSKMSGIAKLQELLNS